MSDTYIFSPKASEDLEDIWLYTEENWGSIQADRYYNQLTACCQKILSKQAHTRPYKVFPALRYHHCQHHYIFYTPQGAKLVITAVLHENMDILEQFIQRL